MAEPRAARPGKQALMRAAVEVMGEDGYEGASIRDMASRAGVSVAALYYHFPSKQDLLREFLDEAHDVTLDRIGRRLAGIDDPTERLREIVGTIIWSHLHDEFSRAASQVLVREYTRLDPPARRRIEAKREKLLRLMTSVIEGGIAVGTFSTAEPRETARAVLTLATTLAHPYPAIARPLDEVIELYQGFAVTLAIGASVDDRSPVGVRRRRSG